MLGAMFLVTMAPQLLIIGILALMHNWRRGAGVSADPTREPASAEQQLGWSFRYFALCAFLGACIYLSHRLLREFDV